MFHDRNHAAQLLAERLVEVKPDTAVVVAIPRGGVAIGYHLANILNVPLDIVLSKQLKDPAHADLSIGSVSQYGLNLLDTPCDIPQDYVYHQSVTLRNKLIHRYEFYQGSEKPMELKDKIVILIDDKVACEDQILSCLEGIKNQQPRKIILAIPVTSTIILDTLRKVHEDVVCLATVPQSNSVESVYQYLPPVSDEEVKQFLAKSKEHNRV